MEEWTTKKSVRNLKAHVYFIQTLILFHNITKFSIEVSYFKSLVSWYAHVVNINPVCWIFDKCSFQFVIRKFAHSHKSQRVPWRYIRTIPPRTIFFYCNLPLIILWFFFFIFCLLFLLSFFTYLFQLSFESLSLYFILLFYHIHCYYILFIQFIYYLTIHL